MTNHNPTITSSAETGSFSENSNTTGSTALHTVTGTMNFTDTDHSDTHTASASLKSAVLSSGSVIPAGSLADFQTAMTAVIGSDSNGSGKINWTFKDDDDDFDFLSKNQTLTLTYTIKVADNHGGSSTQSVTITVTGTDDKPMFATSVAATVTEQANHTLSLSPDTANIAVAFTDPDLTNTNYTATVTGVSATGVTSGILPDGLGTAELMAFFNVNNVVKASGSSAGTINTTFAAPDLAFDYLAAGEQVHLSYTIQLDDHAGGVSTQTVVVTVVGTNDAPVFIAVPEYAHLTEGQNLSSGNLTAHGDFLFSDIDLSDHHTVSTTVSAVRSGGGAVPLSNADLLAAMHTTLDDSNGTILGDVAWSFALSNSSVNFLSGGETLTLTYHITIKDPSNATDTETVTVAILGTNHPVVITSAPESASLAEMADTTGSAAIDTTTPVPTGTLAFTDQDLSDTHTVAVAAASEVWSGGSGIPTATQTALATALGTTLHDSTGTGSGGVDWTFSIPDNALDFLAANETLTVAYNVTVSDATTHATQTVTVTINGANDAPVITSGPESSTVAELPGTTNSNTLDSTSPVPTGTLAFTDVDRSDTHSVSVALDSTVWSGDNPTFVPDQTFTDLQTALTTTLHDSTGTGSGGVDWSFAIPDRDLDFLSAGETLTITYDVTVADGFTSSTQQVTVTATGAHDTLVASPVSAELDDTPFVDANSTGVFGNLLTEGTAGSDTSNTESISAVNGSAGNLGTPIAGTYGTLFVSTDGSYFYIANSAVDPLQNGDTATDHFTYTVTDSTSDTATASLDIHIVGTDDNPQITGGQFFGNIIEDAGPPLTTNGGFETGDLTGWFVTPGVSVQLLGIGGEFGNYTADLAGGSGSIEQDVPTTAGTHYTLSFDLAGDPDSSSSSFTAYWDGVQILTLSSVPLGFTHYSFGVTGDTSDATTQFFADYASDGSGMFFDSLSVNATSGSSTETTDGSVSFFDIESSDTHIASFTPLDSGYVGTFSLDPLSESAGSGSVAWHFSVDNADIQYLAEGQSITQTYAVTITDNFGGSTIQDVSVTLIGTNDAPTAVDDNVISDAGASGVVGIPDWALAANDTDPDTIDTLSPDFIVLSNGGSTFLLGNDAAFFDDSTPGGSFTYEVSDGHTTSANTATVTVTNSATLTGTGGDDIIIASNGTESMSGGGGNDILIPNAGSHVMTGGAGNDTFGFESIPTGIDSITDFNNTSQHDTIAISAAGFGGPLTPGMDTTYVFDTSADDQFSGGLFHYDTANNTLYYSPDGTTASASAVVQLQSGVTLQAHDLHVV